MHSTCNVANHATNVGACYCRVRMEPQTTVDSVPTATSCYHSIPTMRSLSATPKLASSNTLQGVVTTPAAGAVHRRDPGLSSSLLRQWPSLCECHDPCAILCQWNVLGEDCVRQQVCVPVWSLDPYI